MGELHRVNGEASRPYPRFAPAASSLTSASRAATRAHSSAPSSSAMPALAHMPAKLRLSPLTLASSDLPSRAFVLNAPLGDTP